MAVANVAAVVAVIKAIYDLSKEMSKDTIDVLTSLNSSRSVVLIVANATGLPLRLVNTHHDHGNFATSPEATIEPGKPGVFGSVNKANSIGTGTEGNATFGNANGLNFRISWDNPFIGGNESSAVTSGNDGLYRAIATTGAGDQKAEMRYTLLQYPHPIIGAIRGKYSQIGWESSLLGFPTTAEKPTSDNVGRFQAFEGGTIYHHPDAKIGAHVVWGLIGQRWQALGAEKFGYPITDETATSDGVGRFNHFRAFKDGKTPESSIYWDPETGAWEIFGAIRDKWISMGSEKGIGFPLDHEMKVIPAHPPPGTQPIPRKIQKFQRGSLIWNSQTGQVSQE